MKKNNRTLSTRMSNAKERQNEKKEIVKKTKEKWLKDDNREQRQIKKDKGGLYSKENYHQRPFC